MANLKVTLQALLPQHHLSRLIGRLAKLEKPAWLKNALIRLFQAQYGISLAEAEYSDARDYPTFNAFFTRALKEGARPLGNSRYLQPADGVLSQRGEISDGLMLITGDFSFFKMGHEALQNTTLFIILIFC